MLLRLFLLLTVLPLVELTLLLVLARQTSVWFTVALVVGTAVAGALLLRWQSGQVFRKVQQELAAGRMPTDALLDGLLVFTAALFLITPGVLTDLTGILLLIPACRQVVRWLIGRWMRANFQVTVLGSAVSQGFSAARDFTAAGRLDDDVIEGVAAPAREAKP